MPSPPIAAIMMVRNEANIIASCIGHLLTALAVDRVYVTDNGSSDATPAILRRIAEHTGRVTLDFDPGDYHQDVVMTRLAQRATADGAEWILPTDADEFLWLPPGVSLAQLCAREGVGGYRVSVRNFLQARPLRRDWPGSLATMCVSALPFGTVAEGQAAVMAGILPFVRINYPAKLLVRAAPTLALAFGHHDALGTAGPLVPLPVGELLHAPLRAFENLRQRAETGRRTQIVTPGADQNWHLKRIVTMGPAELEAEWRRNSFRPVWPVRRGATQLDFRLCRLALAQSRFRRRYAGA